MFLFIYITKALLSRLLLSMSLPYSVYISPTSAFSIMDHYMRREMGQEQIIGSVIGYPSEDGSKIFIKNCFPVPFKNEEAVPYLMIT